MAKETQGAGPRTRTSDLRENVALGVSSSETMP